MAEKENMGNTPDAGNNKITPTKQLVVGDGKVISIAPDYGDFICSLARGIPIVLYSGYVCGCGSLGQEKAEVVRDFMKKSDSKIIGTYYCDHEDELVNNYGRRYLKIESPNMPHSFLTSLVEAYNSAGIGRAVELVVEQARKQFADSLDKKLKEFDQYFNPLVEQYLKWDK